MKFIAFERRLRFGALDRPNYGYCIYHAGVLAKKLGYDRISVIEFGIAGGRGLTLIEQYVCEIRRSLAIDFEVYGFDTGTGLPKPKDYRDLPYVWQTGQFPMDVDRLREKLSFAELVLGDVRDTVPRFFRDMNPAPVGCVFFDLDFYSSTKTALKIFDTSHENYLPRVFCWFDDIKGSDIELNNEFSGARLAIREFNDEHEHKKLSPLYHFGLIEFALGWHQQVYALHDFLHPLYNTDVTEYPWTLPVD